MMRSFITSIFHKILLQDGIKEDEMGGACSTHERAEKCLRYFG